MKPMSREFRMNGRKRRTWRIYIVAILLIYHGAYLRGDAFQSTLPYFITISSPLKGASSSPLTLRSLRKAGPRTPRSWGHLALKLQGP